MLITFSQLFSQCTVITDMFASLDVWGGDMERRVWVGYGIGVVCVFVSFKCNTPIAMFVVRQNVLQIFRKLYLSEYLHKSPGKDLNRAVYWCSEALSQHMRLGFPPYIYNWRFLKYINFVLF